MTIKKLDLGPSIPVAPKPKPPPPPARPVVPQAPPAAPNVAQALRADPAGADRTANQLSANAVASRAAGSLLPTGLGGGTTIEGYTGPVTVGGPRIEPRSPDQPTTIEGYTGPVTVGGPRVEPRTPRPPTTVEGYTGPVTIGGPRVEPRTPRQPTTIEGYTGPVTVGEGGGAGNARRAIQDFDASNRLGFHNIGGEGQAGPASYSYSGDVTEDGVEGEASTSVDGPRGSSVGIGVGFSVSSTEEVNSEGGFTTAEVSGEVSFNADASAKLGGFGVEIGVDYKTTQSQTVRVPDEAWAEIEAGTAPYPNPYDPYSIPEGGTVTTRNTDVTSQELSGAYRGFAASSGLTETDEVSVQVERVNETTVRVTSGPTSTIESTNGVGIDVGVLGASAEVGRTLETAQVTQVEFDISTPEGQEAYDRYLATGEVPPQGTPGVNDVTQTRTLSLEQTTTLGLSVLGFDLSAEFEGSSANTTLTTHWDGSSDQVSTVDGNGWKITATSSFGPGETEADGVSYEVTLEGVDPLFVNQLNQVYGVEGQEATSPQDITLSFTDENLDEVAAFAREQIVQQNVERGYTREEVEAALDNHDPSDPAGWPYYGDPNWVTIATSESPDEVAQSVARLVSQSGGTGFVGELINIVTNPNSDFELGEGTPFEYSGEQ